MWAWRVRCSFFLLVALIVGTTQVSAELTIFSVGDSGGRLKGKGGLTSRADALSSLREERQALAVDAGNFLSSSVDWDQTLELTRSLDFDAFNVSYRDFLRGKVALLDAVRKTELPVISANLFHAETKELLFPDSKVLQHGDQTIRVVGLTERPRALAVLERLKRQFAGVHVEEPASALETVLKRYPDDQIVLLFYGSERAFAPLAKQLAARGNCLALVAGGGRRKAVDGLIVCPLIAKGASISQIEWKKGAAHATITHLPVAPSEVAEAPTSMERDEVNEVSSAGVGTDEVKPRPAPEPTREPMPPRPRLAAPKRGETFVFPAEGRLNVSGENAAMSVDVLSLGEYQAVGSRKAPVDRMLLFLTLRVSKKPGQGIDQKIALGEKVFAVVNGRVQAPLQSMSARIPGFTNSWDPTHKNTAGKGALLFNAPATGLDSLNVLIVDEVHGNILLNVLGDRSTAEKRKLSGNNEIVSLFVHGRRVLTEYESVATKNVRWLELDLRGTSRLRSEAGGGVPVHWRDWSSRIQLLVDGTLSVLPEKNSLEFPNPNRVLPTLSSGSKLVFRLPEGLDPDKASLELLCGFGSVALDDNGPQYPKPIRLAVGGEVKPSPALRSLDSDDLDFGVRVISVSRPKEVDGSEPPKGGRQWLRLRLAVSSKGVDGNSFDPRLRVQLIDQHRVALKPHYASWDRSDRLTVNGKPLWIPQGDVRYFSLLWQVQDTSRPVRLRLNGLRDYRSLQLEGEPKSEKPLPEDNPHLSESGLKVIDPSLEARGIDGVGLKPEDVNRAIDDGMAYLWGELQKEANNQKVISPRHSNLPAMYALVHSKAHEKYPAFKEALRASLRVADPTRYSTYEISLLSMIVVAFGEPEFRSLLEQCTSILVETQGESGTWSYKGPHPVVRPTERMTDENPLQVREGSRLRSVIEGPPLSRTQGWVKGVDGDNSCTQFAVLGLWAAERAGVDVADIIWERVFTSIIRRQNLGGKEDNFGGYSYVSPSTSYGSMTSAGLSIVAIAGKHLDEKFEPLESLRVRNGLAWLQRNFTVSENPAKKCHRYYYLYSLERVGQILGLEFYGKHEWYPIGAKFLVQTQHKDGSWPPAPSETSLLQTTAFALLFLTRATPELTPTPKSGPGFLAADFEQPENNVKLYIILDASGSMRAELNGVSKFDRARQAIHSLLKALPEEVPVALRAYGHSLRAIEKGANEDTALIVPFGTHSRKKLSQKLDALRPRGKTPLAFSLEESLDDLAAHNSPDTLLILLTDGGDDSRGDPVKAAKTFAEKSKVRLRILGFDINRDVWTRQLTEMAKVSGGRYQAVREAEQLAAELRALVFPVPPSFSIWTSGGEKVADTVFGDKPIELPPGRYTIRVPLKNGELESRVRIVPGETSRIELNAKMIADQLPAERPVNVPPTEKEPTSAFCGQCGAKVQQGAKFCVECGAKL